ncbi:efflux RND transporter periplasmic adaptor subunit [Paeniroseomonas aquatica]|uniref:Efflux RND transporter periplasmic adaptor subunit n=1 Tax=Paeniroseomonas aquatica TaxID=373043 RepID=A0ABT8A4D7_9PROT|nr:efflux RND transporter periplasmic adaptor subunit [Paeniroseomonas aquatica]MDN3564530.1 efflux RND transporter periplasmic adaptor subunit [Paeniroseomonas aquatica]
MPDHGFTAQTALAPAATPVSRRRVRWGGAVLLVLLLAAGAAAWLLWPARPVLTAPSPGPQAAPPALTVALATVTAQSLARPVFGDGSVVAWQELVVGIETGGLRILEVPVEEGDGVRRGQLLARLDDALPAAQAAQAEAAVREAEAALAIAQSDLRRSTELARSESVARQILEQRQSAALQAEARLLAARARRDEAAARLGQTRILAPTDGTIARRSILPGAVTIPGQEALRLIRDSRLELDARVPELDLAALRPGQPVLVRHGSREIMAQVRALAPVVGSDTRLGIVHVALPADSGLRPGMFAQAEFRPEAQPGLIVPQEAVVFREGRPFAFVVPAGSDRAALRPLTTGLRRGGVVDVTRGLAEGERVVITGAGFLSDGDRVRLAP